MDIRVEIRVNAPESKEAAERLVQQNLENKMASYLKKYDKEDAEGTIEVKIEKKKKDENAKDKFNGILSAKLDTDDFRYSREDYQKLDDLINHLFDHFKEELSSK